MKNDVVSRMKLQAKYEGLTWYDPDHQMMTTARDEDLLYWPPRKPRGIERKFYVVALCQDHDPTNTSAEDDETVQWWQIGPPDKEGDDPWPIYECIANTYKGRESETGIKVILPPTKEPDVWLLYMMKQLLMI